MSLAGYLIEQLSRSNEGLRIGLTNVLSRIHLNIGIYEA